MSLSYEYSQMEILTIIDTSIAILACMQLMEGGLDTLIEIKIQMERKYFSKLAPVKNQV